MRAAIIINPVSGAGRGSHAGGARRALALQALAERGLEGDVFVTEGQGHAFELARLGVRRGASVVCAWGGDGTVNEVASALAFGSTPLAIVRAGSGNGLARELGIPRDPIRALAVALSGRERTLDAGEIGGRLFFNLAGIGFDARIAAEFAARAAGRRGFGPYLALAARAAFDYEPRRYRLRFGAGSSAASPPCREIDAMMIVVANARQFGGHAIIAPDARPDDGLLDLVTVAPRGPLGIALAMPSVFLGRVTRLRGVESRAVDALTIEADERMPFHVDGEPVAGAASLAVAVRPSAIRVRVPGT